MNQENKYGSFLDSVESAQIDSKGVPASTPRTRYSGRPRKPENANKGYMEIGPNKLKVGPRYGKNGRVLPSKRLRHDKLHWKVKRMRSRKARRKERLQEKWRLYYKQFEDSPYGRFKNFRKAAWLTAKRQGMTREEFLEKRFLLTYEEFVLIWAKAGKVFCPKTRELKPAFDVKVSKLKKDGACITRIDRTKPYQFDNMDIQFYGKFMGIHEQKLNSL